MFVSTPNYYPVHLLLIPMSICTSQSLFSHSHSDYRTVSHYWVLLVYVALIRAVWADDGDRPLLLWRIFGAMAVSRQELHGKHMAGPYSAFPVRLGSCHVLAMEIMPVSHPQACRSVCQFYNQPIRCPRGSASASISSSYCAQRFSVLYAYGMMARKYFFCSRNLIGLSNQS
jgi:hypothetical protein